MSDVKKDGAEKRMSVDELKDTIAKAVASQMEEVKTSLEEKQSSFTANFITQRDEQVVDPKARSLAAGRLVRALAAAKGDAEKAAHWVSKNNDDAVSKLAGDAFEKALAAGDFTAGGFMVPEDMANDIIDLLRPRSVVRAAGAPTIPMPNGTMTLPKQTGDITATYVGENQNITKTEPTGGQIVMSAKKLAALVPISNDLMRYAPGTQADSFVRNSLVRRIAVREDQAFIRDDGTSSTPKGLRYWAASANVTATNGTSAANIEQDFIDLIEDLEGSNVDMTQPAFIMSSRSKNHLLTERETAGGNLIFPGIRDAQPNVLGIPVFVTNNIPNNLGGGTETELYLVNMPDVIIGEVGTLELTVDASASYVEGANLVSAFSRDQTVIRAIMHHDLAVAYEEAVAVKTGVAWGA